MARPKGAKSDPIGTFFTRVERDMKYISMRYKSLRTAYRKLKAEQRLAKKMGL